MEQRVDLMGTLVGTVSQILAFALIPLVWHLVTQRRVRGFWQSIGLYRPPAQSLLWAVGLSALVAPIMLILYGHPGLRSLVLSPATLAGRLRAAGWSGLTLTILLIHAFFQTALAEEILFRGFLARRLIAALGETGGLLVQALIFGFAHSVLLLLAGAPPALGGFQRAYLFVLPAINGWLLGYLNERFGNGSILPSWLAHGLSNTAAFAVMAFLW